MIDIIIPSYNAHNTIKQTLFSIALQNIKDKLNVYIIDDCSTEDYSNEIELFKDKLNISQLKIVENRGPGFARQYGIDNSKSDYIMFIDSDDVFVDCFSVENLYNNIIKDDYDMAIGIMIDETKDSFIEYQNHVGCLHGKMYKRKFLEKYNLRFNDTRSSEDNAFNNIVLLANPKIVYVDKYIYMYRYNVNSVTNYDRDYSFVSTELYIYNTLWCVENAEQRNFDKYRIIEFLFSTYCYSYYIYLYHLDRYDLNLIFKWLKPLQVYYKKYIIYLDEKKKYNILDRYQRDYGEIPIISFYEFINLIDLHNKN